MLRLESPFQAVARIPTEDLELPGGERLTKGALVTACLGAANRDPDVFDDPDALRPGRDDAHLAFAAGRHFCLGAALARLETRIAVEVLVGAGAALRARLKRGAQSD